MKAQHKRIVVASMLAALAIGYGVLAYYSFVITDAFTLIARRLLNKPPVRAAHPWDEWFFMAVCAVAILGAIGTFFRTNWSRIISLIAFGASGLWALTISIAPESWQGVWFSTSVERWAAALITLFSVGGLAWLCTRAAKDEFRGVKVAS
jgi:hypothetical protein